MFTWFGKIVKPDGHGTSNVGIFGGIFGRPVQRHFAKGNGLLASPAQVLEGEGGVAKVAGRQIVHAVVPAPGIEGGGSQSTVLPPPPSVVLPPPPVVVAPAPAPVAQPVFAPVAAAPMADSTAADESLKTTFNVVQ